jgi:uncharacterized protein (TIGR02246 family)
MVRHLGIAVILGAVVGSGCGQAPAPAPAAPAAPVADAPADIAALDAARAAFMAAYEKGDAEAIGQLYTAEAISEPNNQPTLTGRDAIVASLKNMFEQVDVKVTLEPDETRTLGSVGLDRGRFAVTVTPKSGAPPTSGEGRYSVIFVKQDDGSWKVSRDMDNAVMPPAAPAAADAAASGK